jgi:hypothetical protein
VQSGYKEVFGSIQQDGTIVEIEESNFETPACQDKSLGAEELK